MKMLLGVLLSIGDVLLQVAPFAYGSRGICLPALRGPEREVLFVSTGVSSLCIVYNVVTIKENNDNRYKNNLSLKLNATLSLKLFFFAKRVGRIISWYYGFHVRLFKKVSLRN